MINVAEVLGWKFDYIPGIRTENNVLTAFPGQWPTEEEISAYALEYDDFIATKENNDAIKAELDANDLKAIRAVLDNDIVRINDIKAKQAALRARLL